MILNTLLIMQACALFALLIFPVFFVSGVGAGPTFAMQTLAAAAFAAAATRALLTPPVPGFRKKHRHALTLFLGLIPFLLYVFAQAASGTRLFRTGFGSVAPFVTLEQGQQLACYLLLFAAFYSFFRTRRRVRAAAFALACQAAALIAIGYYHSIAQPEKPKALYGLIDMTHHAGYYSAFLNPNYFGAYLVVLQPAFLASLVYYVMTRARGARVTVETVEKVFLAAMIPLITAASISADARGSFFWQIAMLAMFFAALLLRRPAVFFTMSFALLTLLAVSLIALPTLHLERLSKDLVVRVEVMKESLGMLRDFAWFGSGLGTSSFVLMFYQRLQPENLSLWQPYNTFLQLACEAGWVGAALFLAPVGSFLVRSYAAARASLSRWDRIFGLASFIILFSYLLPGMIDNYVATPVIAVAAIFYAAVLARCANNSFDPSRKKDAEEPSPLFSPARIGLAVAVWVAFGFLVVRAHGDFQAGTAWRAQSKELSRLERAAELRPNSGFAWIQIGHWHYNDAVRLKKQGEPYAKYADLAYDDYLKAVTLAPTWPLAWTGLAKAEVLRGEHEEASRHFDFALRLNPANRDLILYVLNVQLNLAKAAVWPDDRQRFEDRALYWVGVASRLPRPLTPTDCVFLRNWAKQFSKEEKEAVSALVARFYRAKAREPIST